jgi:microcystin-dependent protein
VHRIDTPGNVGGLFVPPNPLTGQQAVVIDSAWLNDLQENIMAVLAAADIAPVKGTYTQLRDAILALITGDFPAFVSSFNTRTGAVVLTLADVETALTFTPVNKAGDTITGNLTVDGVLAAFTASGDHGIRILAPADGSAAILQFTDQTGTVQWATLTASAAGQPLEMNGHPLATLDSPAFTGDPTAPTAAPGTATTQLASTAFVAAAMQLATPTGAVMPFAMAAAPAGWLACNGAAVNRVTYATLFAAIGTLWGVGDGATTFNLPDLRGEFVRGLDSGRGVDTGRALGTTQAGSLAAHNHNSGIGAGSGSEEPFVYGGTATDCPGAATTGQVHADNIATAVQGITSTTGGTETRPTNVALLYCIKT